MTTTMNLQFMKWRNVYEGLIFACGCEIDGFSAIARVCKSHPADGVTHRATQCHKGEVNIRCDVVIAGC